MGRFRIRDWWDQQDRDKDWIREQEQRSMSNYKEVFSGILGDNSKGVQANSKAPKYRSTSTGKNVIVAKEDIPKGSIVTFAAWGGSGQYGHYIKLSGQLVEPEHMPTTDQSSESPPDFDDDIPF